MIPRTSRLQATGCLLALAASLLLSACGGDVSVSLPIGGATTPPPPNPEYVLGINTPGTTAGASGNWLVGSPVSVPTQTNLLRFGTILGGGTTAAQFQMALYAGNTTEPGTFVTNSPIAPYAIGTNEVSAPATVLLPGTYWVMIIVDATFNLGDAGGSTDYRYVNHPFNTGFPGNLTGATTLSLTPRGLNLWMVVQD